MYISIIRNISSLKSEPDDDKCITKALPLFSKICCIYINNLVLNSSLLHGLWKGLNNNFFLLLQTYQIPWNRERQLFEWNSKKEKIAVLSYSMHVHISIVASSLQVYHITIRCNFKRYFCCLGLNKKIQVSQKIK